MKKIILFLFVFASVYAEAQIQFLGAPTVTVVNRGNFRIDSILYLPKRQKLPVDSGALRYQISDSSLYVWTGSTWRKSTNNGTVTSIASGTGMTFATITGSGTINADTLILSTRAWKQKGDDSLGAILSTKGTVSSVATGYGINGGTITTTGTLTADTLNLATRLRLQKVGDSLGVLISNAGGGTVTGVSAGTGMSFTTITSSGAVNADTLVLSTRSWRQKGDDSVSSLIAAKLNISDTATMLSPYAKSAALGLYLPLSGGTLTGGLTGTTGAFTSSGSGNTFDITHSSGSGIGLNITKGGNGEGLYVNKTSGTGNAATIVGTLNATTLVKSGGTATQYLMADGTTSTLTNPVTGTGTTNYLSKWTGISTQGNSAIFSTDSANVFIGQTSDGLTDANRTLFGIKGATNSMISMRYGSTLGGYIWAQSGKFSLNANNTALTFNTGSGGGSERMRIFNSGTVAINSTTDNSYQLDVNGTLRNTTGAAFATSSGNVLIGTTTDGGSYKLDVQGALRNTTGAAFATTSGNVVIGGTGTGTQKLEVVGGDALINTLRVGRGANSISSNVIVGSATGTAITTGSNNNFFGNSAGSSMIDGTLNLAIGNSSFSSATSAGSVTAVGVQALAASTGSENTALGRLTLSSLVGGGQNTALGTRAGEYIGTTGSPALTNLSNSILIGYSARTSKDSNTNEIVIAHQGRGNGSNTTTIGNSSTTMTYLLGKLDVGSFDSTATGMNMLYADATGVIKKAAVPSGGGGSVTSITAGTGLTGGTITTSGTIAVDTASIATRARVQKGVDSVATLANTKVGGTGISGYFPKWTGTGTQDTSQLFQLGRNIGIGTASPTYRLHLPDAGNTANQAMLAGTIFGSDGNGNTIVPGTNAMTYYGQGGDGYLYGAQVSGGKWGVNTRSLGDATFNVNGNVKIVTIDSTSTARNMLYQDANGVIKKSAVPSGLTMADDVITASGSWVATKDAGSGTTINNVAYTTNGTTKMVTVDGNFYIEETGWTNNTWVTIGTIPSDYRPKKTVNWDATFIVSGAEYERADNTDFTGAQGIQGQMRVRDDGTIQINALMDVPTIAAGGTDYIVVPFQVSYIVK